MKLRATKRVTIFVPLAVLGIAAYVTLFQLAEVVRTLPGFLALLVGLAAATFGFSTFAFRAIS